MVGLRVPNPRPPSALQPSMTDKSQHWFGNMEHPWTEAANETTKVQQKCEAGGQSTVARERSLPLVSTHHRRVPEQRQRWRSSFG